MQYWFVKFGVVELEMFLNCKQQTNESNDKCNIGASICALCCEWTWNVIEPNDEI